jgi:histidinol-phosphate aminotransferase
MSDFLRPNIRAMVPYTPGEQPRDGLYVKLNTNESPYPPSPRVLAALRSALTGDRLRRYPEPVGTTLRQTAGRMLGVDPDAVLIGNGSDDILTIVTRAFVPEGGHIAAPTPSYLLYRTLAAIQGANLRQVPYTDEWHLPDPWPARQAHLTFVNSPNNPSGTTVSPAALDRLADSLDGPLLIDEAYVDFADANALPLAARPNVIVMRSLSKSYALAGIRFGFAVAQPDLVRQLVKVKDSYNCDALSLTAAAAALEDQEYYRDLRGKVLATRSRLSSAMADLGFEVTPSQANFVWCRHRAVAVRSLYEELKRRLILVRYMNYDGYGDGLRISVGTDAEIDRLLEEVKQLV